jgi:CelD/BcsL family acetyltransferase involved in cellulose biosynthesis
LRIVVHKEIPEDCELRRQWNQLALQNENPQVFYTYEWALAVQAAYLALMKPLLLLGYEGNDLLGVASLATDLSEKEISFLAANTADYCDFLSAPSVRSEFIDNVFPELRKNNASIKLANIPADSETVRSLNDKAREHGFYVYLRPGYLCSQVELGESKLRLKLKTELAGKKKMRRYLREMERLGPVTFVHLQSGKEIQTALPEFAEAHVARFRATGRVSSLSTPERRLFLQELARRFEGSGVVTLSQLKIGDRPVAWNYGFQFQGSWFWYQPTFDSSQEENSPGHCLLSRIVMEACDMQTMRQVDLGLGAEGYKERFGNATRQTLYATVCRSPIRHLTEMVRYRVSRELKNYPRVESVLRRSAARLLARQ